MEPTVLTAAVDAITTVPAIIEQARILCGLAANEAVTVSDALAAACASEEFPAVTRAGVFRNTGIGAELNTLIRNIARF